MSRINTYKKIGYPHLFQYKIIRRFHKIFCLIFQILRGVVNIFNLDTVYKILSILSINSSYSKH